MNELLNLIPDLRNKSLLITGGSGFFGKNLCESLSELNKQNHLGLKIYALSRNPIPFDGIETFSCDITKEINLGIQPDYIIHAATPVIKANPDFHQMMDVIVNGTENVLKFAEKNKSQKILIISSGAVYGEQPKTISHLSETDTHSGPFYDMRSAYGTGKRISELLSFEWSRRTKIPISIARCFAFSGKHLPLDEQFAIGNFVRDGLNGKNIEIKSDGLALRSYMDADDLVAWLMTILLKGKNQAVYNVGSDQEISIKGIAEKVASFFPEMEVIVQGKYNPEASRSLYVPSTAKAKNELNLKLNVSLEESIKKMIEFNKRM